MSLEEKLSFPAYIPFVEQLGFELVSFGDGQAVIELALAESHMNSFKVAHGGVVMTLLDVVMAHAARSSNPQEEGHGPGLVTIEMKTSFMRPGEGRLRAVGKLLHRTATMAFCEGSVFDDSGKLCAHSTGTFKFIKALPARDKAVMPLQRTAPDQA